MLSTLLLHGALLASHQVTGTSVTTPAPLVEREEISISFGSESFEQFNAVHVSTAWSSSPMILIPPTGFQTSWFETTADYHDSMLGRLAYLGVDVWVVEQRHGNSDTLPAGSCAGDPVAPVPAPVDCSAFGQWQIADVIGDIAFVRSLIGSQLKPTIGGHWTGAMTAVAAVNDDPSAYSGLMLWEGTIYTDDPVTLAKNSGLCAALSGVPDAFGADPTPASEFLVATLAEQDPNGISPFPQSVLDPFFLTAGVATNLEFLHAIFIVDNFALLDRVSQGLVFMVGSVQDGPSVSDIDHVFNLANTPPQGTYASIGLIRDLACALGGTSDVHTDNLAAFQGDVFAIGSQRGMDDELADTLDAFSSADLVYSDFRGELGVHDLLWSDLREHVDYEIWLFNLIAQI